MNKISRLITITKKGDVEGVIGLLSSEKEYLDSVDEYGNTALHWACFINSYPIASLLIMSGAPVNIKNNFGYTPLKNACANASLPLVKLLLNNGAKVDIDPSLAWAAECGALDIVKLLVERGAPVNAILKHGVPSLLLSCENERLDVAEYLLLHGAEVDSKNKNGFTSLFYACCLSSTDMARLLLKHNATINLTSSLGFTPFFRACMSGNVELIHLLMEHGADVDMASKKVLTPLFMAYQQKNINVAALLIENFANLFVLPRNKDDIFIQKLLETKNPRVGIRISLYIGNQYALDTFLDKLQGVYSSKNLNSSSILKFITTLKNSREFVALNRKITNLENRLTLDRSSTISLIECRHMLNAINNFSHFLSYKTLNPVGKKRRLNNDRCI
ncbi:MAG: ankyrin repeat domain-containing protein [Clostridiales bacterium]|nr:ankyrin repeat domain-containing protein [Clostridiales bacterium]